MYSGPPDAKNSVRHYYERGLVMLNKIMWNIFKETGNIYAYLYVKECGEYLKECNECRYNEDKENSIYTKKPLELNEITIVT